MTAVLPEQSTVPEVQVVVGGDLIRSLDLTLPDPAFVESITSKLTESYADFDARMTAKEARDA